MFKENKTPDDLRDRAHGFGKTTPMVKFYCIAFLLLSASCLSAENLRLAAIFGDKMVLQRDMPVPVWGLADKGEIITVSFAGQEKSATAGEDGKWMAILDPLKVSSEPQTMTLSFSEITKSANLQIKNILVGEVWICSGQSNMEMALRQADNSYSEVAAATRPDIRLFKMKGITWTGTPYTPEQMEQLAKGAFFTAKWADCVPDEAKDFSAAAYYFGRELADTLHVPIGLVCNAVGGSPAESWTSREALSADPDLRPFVERDWLDLLTYDWCVSSAKTSLKPWFDAVEKTKSEGKEPPPRPGHVFAPTFLYDNMLKTLSPFAFRGVIWYQGESNDHDGYAYAKKFATMINCWRALWGRDFPFLFVQLPNFGGLSSDGLRRLHYDPRGAWALTREAQRAALSIPGTAMAVTIELGERNNIHPKNKKDVGHRLALLARNRVYGEDIIAEGPVYKSMKVEGDKVFLQFTNVGGSLAGQYGYLSAFSVAGEDQVFHPALARLKGNDGVELSSENVKAPVAVRYGWCMNPECTLYNCEPGKKWPPLLPASPFRTDDWPLPTTYYRSIQK